MQVMRKCRHCGSRYEVNPDYDLPDAWNYCGPDCHYAHEIEPDIKRQEARETAFARKDELLREAMEMLLKGFANYPINLGQADDLINRIRKELEGKETNGTHIQTR